MQQFVAGADHRLRPGSLRPTVSRYSFCASAGRTAIWLSILAETTTASAPSSLARAKTRAENVHCRNRLRLFHVADVEHGLGGEGPAPRRPCAPRGWRPPRCAGLPSRNSTRHWRPARALPWIPCRRLGLFQVATLLEAFEVGEHEFGLDRLRCRIGSGPSTW